jgi:hypothetical protein
MGNFSTRQDLYINKFNNPKIKDIEKTFCIRGTLVDNEKQLIFDSVNPFKQLISQKDASHEIVVTGMYLIYLKNETKQEFKINIDNVFVGNNMNQDVKHEDDTGCIKILCPASYDGPVNEIDGLLYKPRLRDEMIRKYAGMEIPNDEQLVFEINHPLVHFILHHTERPQYTKLEDNFFKFEKEYLEKMKNFFKATVFEQIHRTRFEDTKINCDVIPVISNEKKVIYPCVTFIIQLNGLLIMPGENKMKHLATKI